MTIRSRIRCFWLEETDRVKIFLRRYRSIEGDEQKCPGRYGFHNAALFLEERAAVHVAGGRSLAVVEHQHDDARWPAVCAACGYVFRPEDPWQVNHHTIYRRADSGELLTLEEAPAGAMWNAWWMVERRTKRGPGTWVGDDGISLHVRTPGGDWCVDAPPAGGNGGWTRSGTPPDVTASPSIVIGQPERYHGFLRAGWLEEC